MTLLLLKGIKPARLKVDAFRLEMLNALRQTGNVIEKEDYGAITKSWKHKPVIEILVSLTGPGPVLLVATDDEIFGYLNEGTPPHKIRAKNAPALRFQKGYKAKTKVRWIGSQGGGPFGPWWSAKEVDHPGIEARKYDEAITKKRESWYKRRMERAMTQAAKKSGYGK